MTSYVAECGLGCCEVQKDWWLCLQRWRRVHKEKDQGIDIYIGLVFNGQWILCVEIVSIFILTPLIPRMENNSYASTAGATAAPPMPSVPLVAETGQPVPDSQLKPVHSNYVPGQVSASKWFSLKITFLCRWRSTLSSWTFPTLATSSWEPAVLSLDTGSASFGI